MNLSLVPSDEQHDYAQMPATLRREFDYIEANLAKLLDKTSGPLRRKCRNLAPTVGITARQLYDRVCKFKTTGDWKDLTNRAKAGKAFWRPSAPGQKPACFREWVKGMFERFQRSTGGMAAYKEILFIWRNHHDSEGKPYYAIPGYDEWPEVGPSGEYPEGWSYRNLINFAPENWDAAAAQQGLFAASKFRPPLITTRYGLPFARCFEFDDHEHNVKAPFPGQPREMRPRGFWHAERLSAFLTGSWKPTLWDEEEQVKKTLTGRDFMWFVITMLTTVGFRTDGDVSSEESKGGTWLITEHGCAAVGEAFQERIWRATKGCVKIARPGMFDKAAHGGQFGGKGKGNFKHKPLIESSFNLIDNSFSALPGQTGLDRLTAPEDMNGREQYFAKLLKAAAEMPPERSEKLILPSLVWAQFLHRAMDIVAAINADPDHDLEGWLDCGFQMTEFRLPCGGKFTPWQPRLMIDSMPAPERTAMELVLREAAKAGQVERARNLSRREVFLMEQKRALDSGVMEKLSPWRYHDLLGMENSHEVVVRQDHLIKIEKRELGPRPLYYLAVVNERTQLATGETYRLFANPFSPRVALLCRDDGRAVGLVEQWDQPCRDDQEGIKRMVGKQRHWEAERLQALERRHADEAAQKQHMIEHNDALIHPGQKTSEDRATERDLNRKAIATARADKDLEAAMDTPAPKQEQPRSNSQVNALEEL